MGFSDGRIVLNQANGTYYPGQTIFGKVIFDESKPKTCKGIYVVIKGLCKVYWSEYRRHGLSDTYESYEEYIHRKQYLIGGTGGNTTLPAGHHELPFECELPTDLPSSYEHKLGHIRYGLKAVVEKAIKFNEELTSTLTILPYIDLNLIPKANEALEFKLEDIYMCWCRLTGTSEILVRMPARAFCVGHSIPVEVTCKNDSSVIINLIRMCIRKDSKYIATSDSGTKLRNDVLLQVTRGPVPPRSNMKWEFVLELPKMSIYNLDKCKFIENEYFFTVNVEAAGCHMENDGQTKILFGNVPLRAPNGFPNREIPSNPPSAPVLNEPLELPPSYTAYPGKNAPEKYPGVHMPR